MLAKDLMKTSLVTLPPSEPVYKAAKLMKEHNIGSILVIDAGKLVGIFTERDLVRLVADGNPLDISIGDVMTKDLVTAKPDDPAITVICRMAEHNIRHVPVIDDEGKPVGIISGRDVMRNLF